VRATALPAEVPVHPLFPVFEPWSIPLPFTIPIVNADSIHLFGIMVAIGFVTGSKIAMNKCARDGLDPEIINKLVGYYVLAVFLGGHWGHLLFYYPEEIAKDPMVLLRFKSGLSSFGGFVASLLLTIWFFFREQGQIRQENRRLAKKGEPLKADLNIWPYADSLLYGFTIGWMFGRIGCFSAHDHPGTPTNFWLGVPNMNPSIGCTREVACHDLGLYEAIWSFVMYGVFRVLDKKPRFPGFFAGVWVLSYGSVRIVFDAFRHPNLDTRYFGLTPAQYGSMLMIVGGIAIFMKRRHLSPVRTVQEA